MPILSLFSTNMKINIITMLKDSWVFKYLLRNLIQILNVLNVPNNLHPIKLVMMSQVKDQDYMIAITHQVKRSIYSQF